MDTLFENRYLATDKMLSEYIRKVLYKKMITTGFAFSAVNIVFLVYTLYSEKYVLAAIFGVCLALMLSVAIFSPLLAIRQIKESTKRINNGKEYETVMKFGKNISISEGTFCLTVEYSQIIKIHQLQYSYALMFGKHNAVLLSPKHFTIGTFEDFKEFIGQNVMLKK